MNKSILVGLTCLALVSAPSAFAEPILAVDFGQSQTPSLVETGFSEFEVGNSVTPALVTGTFGAYSVTLAGSAAVDAGGTFTSAVGMTGRDRGNPTSDVGTFTYNDVYRDFVTLSSGALTMGIQLSGFTANTSYAVTFYVYDALNARSVTFKNITGANTTTPNGVNQSLGTTSWSAGSTFGSTTSNEVFSVSGTAISDSLGRVTFSNTINGGSALINGLTVTAIPEPSTSAILLGGVAAMAGIARRRRRA